MLSGLLINQHEKYGSSKKYAVVNLEIKNGEKYVKIA